MADPLPIDAAPVGQPMLSNPQALPTSRRLPLTETTDSYRSVSVLAVCGLLFGVASIFAWTHPLLWAIPAVGVIVCALAFRQLAHYAPNLIGWKAAWLGLALALTIGVSAVTHWTLHHFLVQREAARVGQSWLEDFHAGRTYDAHQAIVTPAARLATGSTLKAGYEDAPSLLAQYDELMGSSLAKAIRGLPGDPQFRLYDINKHQSAAGRDRIDAVYAVTYTADGKRKTFFVQIIMHRVLNRTTGKPSWQIVPVNNAFHPE